MSFDPPAAHQLASVRFDPAVPVGTIHRRLFGGFVEHLGRCVYDGIHEPSHPTADAAGFRSDVKDLLRELGVTTVRYPGGNFVSGHRWEDGVGPVADRPRRLDLAWHSTETHQVGLHEFAGWLDDLGSELMLAVNLGTRGLQEALDLLEYANIRGGTTLSDRRIANGRREPFDVRMWCLGNEMDGPWQLGHRSAQDYGVLAAQVARGMRQLDPRLQLVVCGSSSAAMPTFGTWERTVLEHTYDEVDYISCHAYYQLRDADLGSFLASGVDMDRFIDGVVATADAVKAARHSDKTMWLSFDEWNVWYLDRFEKTERITDIDDWPVAPRLLEDRYSVADAVVVGGLLISLLRHADRVRSASLAQLVNVIAPIMTEPGGPAWRQTTFFPFAVTARLAHGSTLRTHVETPTVATTTFGEVPMVDAVATGAEDGSLAVFAVNRSTTDTVILRLEPAGAAGLRIGEAVGISDDDHFAANDLAATDRVGLRELSRVPGELAVRLPPVSWGAVSLLPV